MKAICIYSIVAIVKQPTVFFKISPTLQLYMEDLSLSPVRTFHR